MRKLNGEFKTPYTKKLITDYLKSIYTLIGRSPTFRDLTGIPGPSARTIVRHFGTWKKALNSANLRTHTKQLLNGERTIIRNNWKNMTDEELSKMIGISSEAVKYYRMQHNLWKNRKGTSNQKHKKDGIRTYGKFCEVCNIPITELHHIVPKSLNIQDWSILCPTCHAVITRKLVVVNSREELQTKLAPYIKTMYKNIKFY